MQGGAYRDYYRGDTVVCAVKLVGEDEQRRSRKQSNYQLPLGNYPVFALRTRPRLKIVLPVRVDGTDTPRRCVGVALDSTAVHPREFLFVTIVDRLVFCAVCPTD